MEFNNSFLVPSFCIILIFFVNFDWIRGQDNYCYEGSCGPANWLGVCKTGLVQSPININPDNTTRARTVKKLMFSSQFYENSKMGMYNTGRFIAFRENPQNSQASMIRVKGGGFDGTYGLFAARFHWGSEHLIKGRRYPLELQIIFQQQGKSSPLDGIVTVLFALAKNDNKALAPIVSLLPKIVNLNSNTAFPNGINLSTLIPPKVWDVFRYQGSMTSPPCEEKTLWNIFTQRMPISKAQLDVFHTLKNIANKVFLQNYRTVQPTYTSERKIIFWAQVDRERSIQSTF